MSGNVIRKIFAKDIDRALTDARADERKLTEEDCAKRYDEKMIRTTGEYELKLKEAESKNKSVEIRLQMAEERMKQTEIQRQEMRELAVQQRQLTSDLVHIMRDYHERRLEELQPFVRLESMALGIEKKLLKIED